MIRRWSVVIFLGVLLHTSHVLSAAVKFDDQTAEASQASNKAVAQQRLDLLGHLFHHYDHHEHQHVQLHHVHDPGYWKKKVVWKSAWKKIWKSAKSYKKIWIPSWVHTEHAVVRDIKIPAWKQIWKPIWREIQVPVHKDYEVADWKKYYKPVWIPTKVPGWKDIQVPDWKKIWKPYWREIQIPAWKDIEVPAWKQIWVPELVKVGIPGEGKLREGDTMCVAGTDGPITTQIRSLLMPQPLKELRVKNAYVEYKEIIGAQGVKIAAKELEKAIAGLNVYVAQRPDEVDICRDEVAKELRSALSHIKLSPEGVYVQASTLGSLEALLEFLRTSKIPYSNIRIGPVVKRDVMKASIMLEHDTSYATILAFDVKVERDAQELADSLGVKIFQADIIYHLFDKFTAYREELKQKKREEFRSIAVFPCKLKILPQFIFNSRDPIVMGVMVENGIVKEGTPICVPSKEFLEVGVVTSIECNHKQVESARKGQEVCIKIEPIPGESPKMYGRHFDDTDMLVSKISRQSIDACKDYFREDLNNADWKLMIELKKLFQIL